MAAKERRRRDRGDLRQLSVELWAGIRYAAALLEDTGAPPELKLRAVSALATASSVYARIFEVSTLEERLTALEETVKDEKPRPR
jgi:hypothetical protein